MTAPTVLASLPKAIIAAAATYQVDPKALARSAGVSLEALDAPGGRIPEAAALRLWECAVTATGDPCLGLVAAQHQLPTSVHALGFAWLASPSLGDMLKRLVRYERVLLNTRWVALEESGDRTALRLLQPPDTEPAASYRTDAAFATLLRWIQNLSLGEIAPLAVEFRHADHGQRNRYEDLFKVPLTFGAATDRMWFDDTALARALPGSNPALAADADRIIDTYLESLTEESTTRSVRSLIIELLPQGEANLEAIAKRLFLSPRSLQRRLGDEAHTFRELLDDTRKSLATKYVRDDKQVLAEVAFRLGFSDQSAFSKAFKRWTGLSPATYAAAGRGR